MMNFFQVRSDRAGSADEVERAAADGVADPDQRHHHAARRPRLPHAPQERVHARRTPRRPGCELYYTCTLRIGWANFLDREL